MDHPEGDPLTGPEKGEKIDGACEEAPGGAAGLFEGKYLAQIQKTRALTALLEGERARVRDLQSCLTRLDELDKTVGRGGGWEGKATRSPRKGLRAGNASAIASSSLVSHEEGSAALKERLDRAYAKLHERERQAAEHRREGLLLRHLLAREIGKTVEGVGEWIQLQKRTVNVEEGEGEEKGTSPTKENARARRSPGEGRLPDGTHAGGGWKGRAEQIVLLQAKVKDLERELEAERKTRDERKKTGKEKEVKKGEKGKKGPDNDEVPSRVERSPLKGNVKNVKSDGKKKDVDDEARDRVACIYDRRQQTARELAAELDASQHALEEGKIKHLALQARYSTVQQENVQLRRHIQVLLEKSRRDDELIETYCEELRIARHEDTRKGKEKRKVASSKRSPTKKPESVISSEKNLSNDEHRGDESSPARSQGLFEEGDEKEREKSWSRGARDLTSMRERELLGLQEMNKDLLERNLILEDHLLALTYNEDEDETQKGVLSDKSQRLLLTWVLEACAALEVAKRRANDSNSKPVGTDPPRNEDKSGRNDHKANNQRESSVMAMEPRAVAAVLLNACAHVAYVEAQELRREPLDRLYRCWFEKIRQELLKGGGNNHSNSANHMMATMINNINEILARPPPIDPALSRENAGLKERLRSLRELLTKEEEVQAKLWAQHDVATKDETPHP
ncbi:unnamed protein product [Phytomonas sp. Hart1]|nr:unnamed protein product [Phytomonas sp. Hart1]|eukprot:CCW72194.1 unnamed protein product [Phytomonas sp. isolate Hart1]